MSERTLGEQRTVAGFRFKLFAAMMLVVGGLTAAGLIVGQRNIAANVERDLQRNFQAELTGLDKLQELRNAALVERCRVLSDKPRIHAALEDNALDLLYASAKDELRDLMQPLGNEDSPTSLHATFYRFLDSSGTLLPPIDSKDVGKLSRSAESQLNLKRLPERQQTGFVVEDASDPRKGFYQIVAVPIFSTDTGEVISALVVGFKPFELGGKGAGMTSGIWVNGILHFPSLSDSARRDLSRQIAAAISGPNGQRNNFVASVDGKPHLLFYKELNPGSVFPAADEICVYPLGNSIARLHRLRWNVGTAAALLLLGGFIFSQFAVARLSRPVEQLAFDSEQNRAQRRRAEAALISTSEQLQRSTRYSADASHQLKTPVTVLRAGIESLLAREDFKPEVYDELSMLLHQTGRLTGVIDDLLLLARMDTGHLEIKSEPVNLSELVEGWLEDLSALSETPEVRMEKEIPGELYVFGERQYLSLIVQNLLENAWKYNRPGGILRATARQQDANVVFAVGNTGRTIPPGEHEHIFERFHRDGAASQVAGHGLGLNLARELTGLHGGELRLVRSADDWTEFELSLPAATRLARPNTSAV